MRKDLLIKVVTDISPAKVDLSQVEAAIEYVIETQFESVCRSVRFQELPEEDSNA